MHVRTVSRTLAAGFVLIAVAAVGILSLGSATHAQEPDAEVAPAPPAPAMAKPKVNPVTSAAVNAGVLTCASRINQVADYLMTNNQSSAHLFVPRGDANRRLFSASFEIITQENATLYASASFAPNQENGVGAVYDIVEYVEKTPDELANTVFKELKRVGVMNKNITVLDGGKVKVFLMPAGTGCVVIRKEVVE